MDSLYARRVDKWSSLLSAHWNNGGTVFLLDLYRLKNKFKLIARAPLLSMEFIILQSCAVLIKIQYIDRGRSIDSLASKWKSIRIRSTNDHFSIMISFFHDRYNILTIPNHVGTFDVRNLLSLHDFSWASHVANHRTINFSISLQNSSHYSRKILFKIHPDGSTAFFNNF
jgi:hypothetical protein